MGGDNFDAIYVVLSALIFWVLYHALRSGRFGSVYGEKLSINRAENPYLFWGQALIVFLVGLLLAWAGFF